jgi:hypothetical protein
MLDTDFPENFNCHGMNKTSRSGAGTNGTPLFPQAGIHDGFCHLGTAGISGAKKKDFFHTEHSF